MLTLSLYQRRFWNIFVDYKCFVLSEILIQGSLVDMCDGIELTWEDVREKYRELEDARREKRKGDEASRATTNVEDELQRAKRQKFYHKVQISKAMEQA